MSNTRHKKNIFKINLADQEQAERLSHEILSKMEQNPGMTLQDATGISDEVLEEIYSLAYTYYNQGKYKEAISLFQVLTQIAPSSYKFVLGLAASLHQIEAFVDATTGFFIALNIEPHNPIPAYYVTDCLIKRNLLKEAAEFAEFTLEICDDRPEYAELQERCRLIKESLKNKS